MKSNGYSDCGFLTMAFGSTRYYKMAVALGRSLVLHNPAIPRAIVTDDTSYKGFRGVFDAVIPYKEEVGAGGPLRHKLMLDVYSPFKRTIFIDSDCLCIRKLSSVFDSFLNTPCGVIGENKTHGIHAWWGEKANIPELMRMEGIDFVPVFNMGFFYLEKGDAASRICEQARSIMDRYPDYPFTKRGADYLDEPCLALAMAKHNIRAHLNDFTVMKVPIGLKGPMVLDVIGGFSRLDLGDKVISPSIIHLPNIWTKEPVYRRECLKLKLWHITNLSPTLVRRAVDIFTNPYYAFYALGLRAVKRLFGRGREHPRPPW